MRSCLSPRRVVMLALAGALAAGCSDAPSQRASRSNRIGENTPQACISTDAHARHASAKVACVACHPCGGAFGFGAAVTYPGGTTSAGGTFTPGTATTPPSCSVGCHSPLGSPAHTVSWGAPGPLACVTCHDVATLLAANPGHPPVSPDATREYCQGCHVMDAHTEGTVAIAGHDADWVDPSKPTFHAFTANQGLNKCQGCHLPDLSGGATGVSCTSCHDGTTAVAWGCVMCHGGVANQTGAPPKATWGTAGDPARGGGVADPVRVGAHTAHVTPSAISPAFACSVCHVTPADAFAPGHITTATTAEVVFGGLAIGRNVPAPTWDRPTASCSSTYCHGATMIGGSTPDWTKVGEGQADCGTCHGIPPPSPHPTVDTSQGLARCSTCHPLTMDALGQMIPPAQGGAHLNGTLEAMGHDQNWTDPMSPEFHAFAVDRNIAGCTGCHGAQLDGGATGISCVSCHDGTQAIAWGCVMCHGGTDNQTGAPPKALWGYAGDPSRGGGIADPLRVGAHTKHLSTTLMSPIACTTCHVVPTDALAPSHIDGNDALASLTWSGMAVTGGASPAWNRASGTCASTYCHGIPPPSPHPTVDTSQGLARCATCHPLTIDALGQVIPPAQGGAHLNGTLEAMGHDQNWTDPTSPEFHAFAVDRNIQSCTGCHGAQLDGGATGISCVSCHDGNTAVAWGCVMCHGGIDNQTGAPPKALWGYAGDPSRGGGIADPLRVGAHTKHLSTTLMSPVACTTCHVVPTDVLAPTHIDGGDAIAGVIFSGMALTGGANPAWNRASGTCASTYCHGNYSGTYVYGVWDWGTDSLTTVYAPYTGGHGTPVWPDGPMTCGSCHGNPPSQTGYWHSGSHGYYDSMRQCQLCHPDAYSETGVGLRITNPAQHVNGIVEVTPRFTSQCFGCH